MTKFEDLSLIKRVVTVLILLVVVFTISGVIGYFRGLSGDDGSTERATSWVIKTGLLWLSLPIISVILARIGDFLENLFKVKLPYFFDLAILLGCAFAIFDGCRVILEIETGKFWSKVLSGFIMGILSGGIAGILIQRTEKTEGDDSAS